MEQDHRSLFGFSVAKPDWLVKRSLMCSLAGALTLAAASLVSLNRLAPQPA